MAPRAHRRSAVDVALIVIAVMFLLAALSMGIAGLTTTPKATVPDMVGSDAQAAISKLEGIGFHSIRTIDSNGDDVSIEDGATVLSQDPAAHGYLSLDQAITLTLKTKQEKEAEEAAKEEAEREKEEEEERLSETEQELEALKGQPASTAYQQLTADGYTIDFTYGSTSEEYTSTVVSTMDESAGENYIPWVVTGYSDLDVAAGTVTLAVDTQKNIDSANAESELKNKLDLTAAWFACRDYGKSKYPYGFTVHYIMGVIAEEAEDSDTWFLKATCDVTNEYGATARDRVVECRVTGTTNNPQVIDFTVY